MGDIAIRILSLKGGDLYRRGDVFFTISGLNIDADGSPHAYHPPTPDAPHGCPPGLDDLRNAGSPGDWWALVLGADRQPIIQGAGDPAPGYYISTTALCDPSQPKASPRCYVDSERVPYIVLPPDILRATGMRLGDLASVVNRKNEKIVHAVFGDIGPSGQIGEGSIALAAGLGLPSSPLHGGTADRDIVMLLYPGSRPGVGIPALADINRVAGALYASASASAVVL